jgi:hypothetical protein
MSGKTSNTGAKRSKTGQPKAKGKTSQDKTSQDKTKVKMLEAQIKKLNGEIGAAYGTPKADQLAQQRAVLQQKLDAQNEAKSKAEADKKEKAQERAKEAILQAAANASRIHGVALKDILPTEDEVARQVAADTEAVAASRKEAVKKSRETRKKAAAKKRGREGEADKGEPVPVKRPALEESEGESYSDYDDDDVFSDEAQ